MNDLRSNLIASIEDATEDILDDIIDFLSDNAEEWCKSGMQSISPAWDGTIENLLNALRSTRGPRLP